MKAIQISDATARQVYPKAEPSLKKILEESFGQSFFSQKITDRVKTFEDACSELQLDPASLFSNEDTVDEKAYKQLKVIARALNEGWTPDWNDGDQYKYYPYFDMRNGFAFYSYDYYSQFSLVGSRLCFKSSELATYAGKQFLSIYKDYFTLN